MNRLKIFSFFSGSGFLDLGFELNGYTIEMVNEISTPFMRAYQYARKIMGLPTPEYGYANRDINEYLAVRKNELSSLIIKARGDGDFIGFIGGPPCPDFSIAGKQKGRDGNNGKLSLAYVNLIVEHRPDFFLFENVKGLWQTARHRQYYEELKTKLFDAGYEMADRLVNALEYGVPQDRDRILLFGVKRNLADNTLGNVQDNFKWENHISYSLDALKRIPWPKTSPFEEDKKTACPDGVPAELTVQYWFDKNHVNTHPNKNDCFVPRSGIQKMRTVMEGDDSKKSYKRLHRWRYSPTVAYGNNEVHLHPYKARRLTVAESLSLQALPQSFALPPDMTLTDKFKTTGNGVPFLLADGIAKTIKDYLTRR